MHKSTFPFTLILFFVFVPLTVAQVDYHTQIQPIFNSRCANCHGGISGVFMSNYSEVMNSVGNQYGKLIVEPFSPEESPLYDKLLPNPQYGNRMPQGGSLTQAQIELIRQWIEEGAFESPATSVDSNELITKFELLGNYPNPFNPSTNIRFSLPENADVQLHVYSLQGQRVDTIYLGSTNRGIHSVRFNANSLASGIYLYRIIATSHSNSISNPSIISGKFTLIK